MAGVNKVILLGNLGQDPEVRHLESGSAVAKLRLATTESYRDKDGNRQEMTEWHDLELWEGLAKIAEKYLKKGDSIYVEGRIKTDKWTDKDGNNRQAVKIRVSNLTMLSKASGGQGGQMQGQPAASQVTEPPQDMGSFGGGNDIDDLPF